jgi:hypothetical protein
MPSAPPQPIQLQCPACRTPFRAAIFTLIDGGEQPELKAALVSGQINVAVCPQCRTPSMLAAPLIYHDADKQLCLVYLPQESNQRPAEQDRFVGEVTGYLMKALPAETPRGHLLAPRRFLSLQSLIEAVLQADGLTLADLERQEQSAQLLSELAGLMEDERAFAAYVAQRRADLTPELFDVLQQFIDATPEEQSETRAMLEALRERLLQDDGSGDAAVREALEAAVIRLSDCEDDELAAVVAELRPQLDYTLFEFWTEQILQREAFGDGPESLQMLARRDRVVELVEAMDREAQELFERGTALLQAALNEADPAEALRARADEVDQDLLIVISANVGAAQRAGDMAMVEVLTMLGDVIQQIITDRMSPEDRFIHELLSQETPQAATTLLRRSFARITPELIKRLNELAGEEEQRGQAEQAAQLRRFAREAGAMLF